MPFDHGGAYNPCGQRRNVRVGGILFGAVVIGIVC
jgi:hypothetical protein